MKQLLLGLLLGITCTAVASDTLQGYDRSMEHIQVNCGYDAVVDTHIRAFVLFNGQDTVLELYCRREEFDKNFNRDEEGYTEKLDPSTEGYQ